jgi:hypothetical protein
MTCRQRLDVARRTAFNKSLLKYLDIIALWNWRALRLFLRCRRHSLDQRWVWPRVSHLGAALQNARMMLNRVAVGVWQR